MWACAPSADGRGALPPIIVQEADTRRAEEDLGRVRGRYLRRWMGAIDRFYGALLSGDAEGAALALLIGEVHAAIDEAWSDAWRAGQLVWGTAGQRLPRTTDGLEAALRRQKEFATRFALDIAAGVPEQPGRLSVANRVAMYGESLEGPYQRGAVEAAPPGQLIWWRLGACQHCLDCPILSSNSPYTTETLPTLPRAGATQCRSRCCCSLEFRPADGVTAPEPEAEQPRGDMVVRLTGPPPPVPPGRRLANDDERRLLRDLELRMAHANRRADAAHAAGNTAERDRWLKVRKEVNAEMIRLTKEAQIHHVPTFSTAEVLRGVDIRAGSVDNLTHVRGLDGTTIHRAQKAAIEQALGAARRDLDKLLAKMPPTRPAVPALAIRVDGGGRAAIGRAPEGQSEAVGWPAVVAEASVDSLPAPGDEVVVSIVGAGARACIEAHLLALEVLAAAPHRIEVGPFDDGWEEVVAAIGTWVRGPAEEVDRFVRTLARRVTAPGIAVAPWQEAA